MVKDDTEIQSAGNQGENQMVLSQHSVGNFLFLILAVVKICVPPGKSIGVPVFSWGIERDQWHETG